MAGRSEITNSAFAEIMAPSASSSTPPKRGQYDVFINHRGPDTKHTLAASIYRALKLMGVEVFLDEPELELGDSIPSEIQNAINTSFLHIAILSPRYAESTWCLEELSLMVKSKKTIIPVFYKDDVSDIRWIKEAYDKAFSDHEGKTRYSPGKIEEWKSALQKVSYLKGQIVKSDDDKEVSKIIANYVKEHPKKAPFVLPEHPVGFDKILGEFERKVLQSSENVKIMGITGIGGCGKTTLAKAYYNKIIRLFSSCSFVCDVRDTSTRLYEKQKKMFQDLGGSKNKSFDSVEEGKAILADYLRFVQVFIILDNVDHLDQLESLLPTKNSLTEGSVIVVTSRDRGILISWGLPSNSIYGMEDLNTEHAMELFCWHAFKKPSPINEFECLVQKFIEVCKGSPLAIKVLGKPLHGKSKDYWNGQLEKFSKSLHNDIKSVLMVSFDALDEQEKEVFLDISCFFIGTAKESAIPVWEESGSLETLIDKCLVEVDEKQCLSMQDLLRDLGRDISDKCSPLRLWSPQQITHIFENQGEESVQIRGIKVQTDEFYEEFMELVREPGRGIKRKRSLKIMNVESNYFTEELATLSEGLVCLQWTNIPHAALPSWIPSKKLRVLELPQASNLGELWSETAIPEDLRVLKIIQARNFQRFPRSIGFLKHLKEISFDGEGAPIEDLPNEFCNLQSLERLKLVGCRKLKSLPSKFGDLINLQQLEITHCSKLMITSEALGELTSLQSLYLSKLPMLTEFIIERSSSSLCSLQHLTLDKCAVSRMSISPHCCPSLQNLNIHRSRDLLEINSLPISVEALHLSDCSSLSCISLNRGLVNLQHMFVADCEEVCKIEGLENCSSLKTLLLYTDLVSVRESLKAMDLNLRSVIISELEPFLQYLNREKWPSKCEICVTAEPGVEAMVESFTFPGVTLLNSLDRQKTEEDNCWEYVFSTERPANVAIMICLVINSCEHFYLTTNSEIIDIRPQICRSLDIYLLTTNKCGTYGIYVAPNSGNTSFIRGGQKVYIGVFLPSSLEGREVSFSLLSWNALLEDDPVKVGILVMGEEERVVDAFYELVQQAGQLINL